MSVQRFGRTKKLQATPKGPSCQLASSRWSRGNVRIGCMRSNVFARPRTARYVAFARGPLLFQLPPEPWFRPLTESIRRLIETDALSVHAISIYCTVGNHADDIRVVRSAGHFSRSADWSPALASYR